VLTGCKEIVKKREGASLDVFDVQTRTFAREEGAVYWLQPHADLKVTNRSYSVRFGSFPAWSRTECQNGHPWWTSGFRYSL